MFRLENMEQVVSLAGLLHDFGKFTNRSSNYVKNIKNKEYKTFKHSVLSKEFICFLEENNIIESSELLENLKELVLKHHESKNFSKANLSVKNIENEKLQRIGNIIASSDNYSASERRDEPVEDDKENIRWMRKPLNPIFETISLKNDVNEKKTSNFVYKLNTLNYETIFSKELTNETNKDSFRENSEEEVYKHICSFFEEIKKIDSNSYDIFFSQLYLLMEKYMWCVASDTQINISDISLFDHLKSTSALALASYKYYKENNILENETQPLKKTEQFKVLVGDVSGIQNFIYDGIKSEGAAKILRGKSFFVKMISDAIALYIIKEFELSLTNIILTAGGKFYILLQNTSDSMKKVEKIKEKLNNYLYKEFFGQLFVNIVTIEANGDEIAKKFTKILEKGNRELNWQKDKRFFNQIKENPIFDVGYRDDGTTALDRLNEKFKEMGGQIPKARFIGIRYNYKADNKETFEVIENMSIQFFKSKKDINISGKNEKIDLVISLNNVEIVENYPTISRFISNYAPLEEEKNSLKSFEDISNAATGNKKIAVYKADVDNLGMIFSIGLKKKKNVSDEELEEEDEKNKKTDFRSISRISTLSRNMEYFFSYWMNSIFETGKAEIWLGNKIKKEIDFSNIYVLYSGGDDLVIIGPWDKIIYVSYFIRKKFEEFVTENEEITLSGGIAISHPKLKIINGINMAGELEEKAKEIDKDKNALTLFDRSFKWDEFEKIFEFAEKLQKIYGNKEERGIITQAFLYRCLNYTEMAEKLYKSLLEIDNNSKAGKNLDFSLLTYISKFEYDYGRNILPKLEELESKAKKSKEDEEKIEIIKELRNKFIEEIDNRRGNFLTKYMRIVLNYIIYLNRK